MKNLLDFKTVVFIIYFFIVIIDTSDIKNDNECYGNLLPDPLDGMDPLPDRFPKRCPELCPLGTKLIYNDRRVMPLADYRRFQHVIKRINRARFDNIKHNLTIAVFGGSMTVGHVHNSHLPINLTAFPEMSNKGLKCEGQCFSSSGDFEKLRDCKACTYPNRFAWWLQRAYPHVNVIMKNMAIQATNSQSILGLLGDEIGQMKDLDVAIINYSDNDRNFGERDNNLTSASFELLIRSLLLLPSNPAVIDLEMFVINQIGDNRGIYEPHGLVLRYYNLPVIVYDRVAFKPFSIIIRHPSWPYHQLTADLLAYVWKSQALELCHPHHIPKPMASLEIFRETLADFCINPRTLIRADRPNTFNMSNKHQILVDPEDSWKYGEDVEGNGKLGWFIDSTNGGKISFKIKIDEVVGRVPSIGVGYLESYEGMGIAKVYLNNDIDRYILINGTGSLLVSQTHFKRICISDHSNDNRSNSLETIPYCNKTAELISKNVPQITFENIEYTENIKDNWLHIELLPNENQSNNKFKIIYIVSC